MNLPEWPRDGSEPADLRRRRAVLRVFCWTAVAVAICLCLTVVAAWTGR
jgi:predicted anti-sigma-YlaC factor YlaD